MIAAGAPLGEVHKDGTVTLNGQIVATNAMSIGHHNMAGSTSVTIGSKSYYNSPPSTSFLSDSISAFIFLDRSGQFIGAILTSCGNPVSATPVKKTPPPPPPTPTVTVKAPALFQCDSLTARLIQADNRTYQYDLAFTAEGGAMLKSVDYDFGDGLGRENVSPDETKNVTHSYAKAGTYITTATLHFMVDTTIKDDNCQVTITANAVAPPPPPELPKTGPFDFVGLGVSLGSLIAAGWYWQISRRHLIATLLDR